MSHNSETRPRRQSAESIRQNGALLREMRIQRLLTLKAAAKQIGCNAKSLEYFERETLGASEIMLEKIARAYGVQRSELRKQVAA
jgi:transcriptional regulator with XRE-family HTH domain